MGKTPTHLAIGLGVKAAHAGYSVLFDTASNWITRLAKASARSTTQAGQVRERKYGGNTKAMAAATTSRRARCCAGLTHRHPTKQQNVDQLQREAVEVQTTERGWERKAKRLAQRGTVSGIGARVGRAAGPDRLECPQCAADREEKELGSLVLPAPTKREQMAALLSTPDDPWWDVRVLHAKLHPVKDRRAA
ncbi:hypothetical protein [Kitasatospora sp. CMC57]|uniref:hypothetical protein n=1 Tax=Kitasatospora sp. CMC57 TaxID=3231513 RepID=UPI0038B6AED4